MEQINFQSFTQRLLDSVMKINSLIGQIDESEPVYEDGEFVQAEHLTLLKGFLQKCLWADSVLFEIKNKDLHQPDRDQALKAVSELIDSLELLPADYNELLEAQLE